MKHMLFYFIAVIVIASITALCVAFGGADHNVAFLEDYGWKVNKDCIDKENIKIPEKFDDVYAAYNDLQKQAGLDLSPYCGKKGVRYTYLVENYPEKTDEPVRANVICVDAKPVAGDIMTVSLGGFMHSLNYLREIEK